MHKSRLGNIVIDCQTDDLKSVATFWSAAIGYALPHKPDSSAKYIDLVTPEGEVKVILQRVEHESRVHLDIETDSITSEVARLEKLGAMIVEQKEEWTVMQAPTGHRFCVTKPFRSGFDKDANSWA